MARATPTGSHVQDAVALLKQDHHTVDQLFKEFERAGADERESIASRACDLLAVHAQIEEEILYPAAREALAQDEKSSQLVYEAAVEHAAAKDLIGKIGRLGDDEEELRATVHVLSEYIKHHVKEEEQALFPELRKTDLDLKEMGSQLARRKEQLMEEMGIEEQLPVEGGSGERAVGARKRSAARGGHAARATARSTRHSPRHPGRH